MTTVIVSAILQLGVALAIALVVWRLSKRPREPFWTFCGVKPAPLSTMLLGAGLGILSAAFLLHVPGTIDMAAGEGSVAASLPPGPPMVTASAILLVAVLKTAFTEELLFRGILARKLIGRLGFGLGNALQAVVFGALHLLLLLVPEASLPAVLILCVFTAVTGWLNGWMKVRLADGSILPGWAAHATANTLAYSAIVFDWI